MLIRKNAVEGNSDLSQVRNRGEMPATIAFLAEFRRLKYKNVAAELRVKQHCVHSVQHELRYIAIFHSAAGRADHNKLISRTPKASKR